MTQLTMCKHWIEMEHCRTCNPMAVMGVDFQDQTIIDQTIVVLPACAEQIAPEFVDELRGIESVDLVIQDEVS